MGKLTDAGTSFLKSAFASPDSAGQGSFLGIPDDVSYEVVPYRHILTGDLWTLLGGSPGPTDRVCIVQPPIPGVAFYYAILASGFGVTPLTPFKAITYDDFSSLFNITPTGNADQLVNSFRFAGNTIELICTSNATQWFGSVRAFKGKLSHGTSAQYTTVATQRLSESITGMEFVNATAAATYTAPSNLGVYMSAVNTEVIFKEGTIPDFVNDINQGDVDAFAQFLGRFTGLGDLETNCIWLEGVTSTSTGISAPTNFAVRAWSAIEYIPVQGTLIAKMAHPSPAKDVAALEIYRAVVRELPVAVSYFNNDSFWQKLLGIINKVTGFASAIPGPIGMIAGGANAIGSTISGLLG